MQYVIALTVQALLPDVQVAVCQVRQANRSGFDYILSDHILLPYCLFPGEPKIGAVYSMPRLQKHRGGNGMVLRIRYVETEAHFGESRIHRSAMGILDANYVDWDELWTDTILPLEAFVSEPKAGDVYKMPMLSRYSLTAWKKRIALKEQGLR